MTETKETEETKRIVSEIPLKDYIELRKILIEEGITLQDFIYNEVKKKIAK